MEISEPLLILFGVLYGVLILTCLCYYSYGDCKKFGCKECLRIWFGCCNKSQPNDQTPLLQDPTV